MGEVEPHDDTESRAFASPHPTATQEANESEDQDVERTGTQPTDDVQPQLLAPDSDADCKVEQSGHTTGESLTTSDIQQPSSGANYQVEPPANTAGERVITPEITPARGPILHANQTTERVNDLVLIEVPDDFQSTAQETTPVPDAPSRPLVHAPYAPTTNLDNGLINDDAKSTNVDGPESEKTAPTARAEKTREKLEPGGMEMAFNQAVANADQSDAEDALEGKPLAVVTPQENVHAYTDRDMADFKEAGTTADMSVAPPLMAQYPVAPEVKFYRGNDADHAKHCKDPSDEKNGMMKDVESANNEMPYDANPLRDAIPPKQRPANAKPELTKPEIDENQQQTEQTQKRARTDPRPTTGDSDEREQLEKRTRVGLQPARGNSNKRRRPKRHARASLRPAGNNSDKKTRPKKRAQAGPPQARSISDKQAHEVDIPRPPKVMKKRMNSTKQEEEKAAGGRQRQCKGLQPPSHPPIEKPHERCDKRDSNPNDSSTDGMHRPLPETSSESNQIKLSIESMVIDINDTDAAKADDIKDKENDKDDFEAMKIVTENENTGNVPQKAERETQPCSGDVVTGNDVEEVCLTCGELVGHDHVCVENVTEKVIDDRRTF